MADSKEVTPEKAPEVEPIKETIPQKPPIEKRDFEVPHYRWTEDRGPTQGEYHGTD